MPRRLGAGRSLGAIAARLPGRAQLVNPPMSTSKPSGVMVIPVGPPGAQRILKVVKKVGADGAPSVARSDIFGGKVIPFVPLSGGHQSEG